MWTYSDPYQEKKLNKLFQKLSIDISTPGFYDSPPFLEKEKSDPRFLENYAYFVHTRTYSQEYLQNASQKIEIVSETLRACLEADGRKGACVDISGMAGRMLDRLGVWNYVAKATLTIEFPIQSKIDPRFFWLFDKGNFVAPHAIIVAPPYTIVDITVRHQQYETDEAAIIPPII